MEAYWPVNAINSLQPWNWALARTKEHSAELFSCRDQKAKKAQEITTTALNSHQLNHTHLSQVLILVPVIQMIRPIGHRVQSQRVTAVAHSQVLIRIVLRCRFLSRILSIMWDLLVAIVPIGRCRVSPVLVVHLANVGWATATGRS